jgi:hypothetical protein
MTEQYRAICDVVPDAIQNLPEGTTLHFEFGQWFPGEPPARWSSNNVGYYKGILLSVHFEGREDFKRPDAPAESKEDAAHWGTCEGSAILVAPGIAITAAHVVEDKISLIGAGKMGISCIGPTEGGLQLWRVHKITPLDRTDLVIMTLKYWTDLPADHRFHLPCISTRLPAIGETVMISGFQASAFAGPVKEVIDGVPVFAIEDGKSTYSANVRAATGRVVQHHLAGRPGIVPGPTIEVDIGTDGGMSGGPVFDASGNLIGVLSTCLHHEDQKGPSIVSLIVPTLGQRVDACFGKYLSGSVRLIDLDPGLCQILGRENLTITDGPSGETRIEIRGWD